MLISRAFQAGPAQPPHLPGPRRVSSQVLGPEGLLSPWGQAGLGYQGRVMTVASRGAPQQSPSKSNSKKAPLCEPASRGRRRFPRHRPPSAHKQSIL